MNTKQMFYKAVNGVFEQGGRSAAGNICRYRDPDGLKCAVGHLMDDKYYNPSAEGPFHPDTEPGRVLVASIGRFLSCAEVDMLQALQAAHDRWSQLSDKEFIPYFMEKCATLAEDYGLVYKGG